MFVFCSLRTRATSVPSPFSDCSTVIKESAVPQMSDPAPLTVNWPFDACALPEVQRVLLVDGPAVLGWDVWRTTDSEYGLGLLEGALQRAIDAGRLPPQPARAAAHVLLGALDEAAMVVARADDARAARNEMGQTVHRLLEGLRVPVR